MFRFVLGAIAAVTSVAAGSGVFVTMQNGPISDPVAVVLVTSLDEAAADVAAISELIDEPKLKLACKVVEPLFSEPGLLGGFDTSRPAGAVIRLQGKKPVGYVVLPIRDLNAVRETFEPFVASIDAADGGVFKIVGHDGKSGYVKPIESWLLVSDRADIFPASLPNAEAAAAYLLDGADVGVHLMVGNIPAQMKDSFLAKIKRDAVKQLSKDLDGNPRLDALRRDVSGKLLTIIKAVTTETESITVTASFDRETTSLRARLTVKAADGSSMASFLNEDAQQTTQFAGFRSPRASFCAANVHTCVLGQMVDWSPLFAEIKAKAHQEIDAKENNADKNAKAKQFVDSLLDVAEKTIASGRRDGALMVVAKPEVTAIAAAGYLANGYQVERTLGIAVDVIKNEHPEVRDKVQLDRLESVAGVNLYKLSFDIPADTKDRDKVVALMGERGTIVVGFGSEAVYAAVGKSAERVLTRAIAASSSSDVDTPRAVVRLSLLDLARTVSVYGDKPREREDAAKAVAVLENYGRNNHIALTIDAIPNGRVATLEIEEGIVQLAIAAAKEKK